MIVQAPIALCHITIEHLDKGIQGILAIGQNAHTFWVAAVIHQTVNFHFNFHAIVPFAVYIRVQRDG
jgi:hypothetical protein